MASKKATEDADGRTVATELGDLMLKMGAALLGGYRKSVQT